MVCATTVTETLLETAEKWKMSSNGDIIKLF